MKNIRSLLFTVDEASSASRFPLLPLSGGLLKCSFHRSLARVLLWGDYVTMDLWPEHGIVSLAPCIIFRGEKKTDGIALPGQDRPVRLRRGIVFWRVLWEMLVPVCQVGRTSNKILGSFLFGWEVQVSSLSVRNFLHCVDFVASKNFRIPNWKKNPNWSQGDTWCRAFCEKERTITYHVVDEFEVRNENSRMTIVLQWFPWR